MASAVVVGLSHHFPCDGILGHVFTEFGLAGVLKTLLWLLYLVLKISLVIRIHVLVFLFSLVTVAWYTKLLFQHSHLSGKNSLGWQ